MNKYLTAIVITLALVSGCEQPVKNSNIVKDVAVSVVYTPELNKVVEEAKKFSKEDRASAYKQLVGISEYIKNSNVGQTTKVDSVWAGVQGDYGWIRGKYPSYSDAMEAYQKSQNYGGPNNDSNIIDSSNRAKYAEMFRSLSEAIKKADKE